MSEGFKGINFKSAKAGTTKTGKNTLALNLSQEQAGQLVERITEYLGNERGVKLTVNYEEVEKEWGPAINAFTYVDPIQAPGAGFGKGGFGGKPAQGKFVPKAKPAGISPTNRAKAASALNTEIED